ncbi:MAG TPA: hypothetical protein VIJ90_06865, partial [Gemmatimonadaceae bacterium]
MRDRSGDGADCGGGRYESAAVMRVEARSGSSRVDSLVMNYLVLVNPLVYVAKGMRDALTP